MSLKTRKYKTRTTQFEWKYGDSSRVASIIITFYIRTFTFELNSKKFFPVKFM